VTGGRVVCSPQPREEGIDMTDFRTEQVDLANLAAAIERAAGDLALAEEPARFIAALEEGAEEEPR
jgi:hypothetical protein